jgi:hypothetical protein
MKYLLVLLLLIPSLSFAKVFNCKMSITSERYDDQSYTLLVDTGVEKMSVLSLSDIDNGSFEELIGYNKAVGKIFFNKGNPYALTKIDREVFFQYTSSYHYTGIHFPLEGKVSTVKIYDENLDANNPDWRIEIADTYSSFDSLQKGNCD